MKFEVYCDESRPDLLGSCKPQGQFMVIGSLWLPDEDREVLKTEIHQLRDEHKIGGEFKWQKVSPSRREFYKHLVEWFHMLKGQNRADFVTAYVADTPGGPGRPSTKDLIRRSPKWP